MSDGFLVLDAKYRVIDFNSAIYRFIYNVKNQKIVGQKIENIFPGEELKIFRREEPKTRKALD